MVADRSWCHPLFEMRPPPGQEVAAEANVVAVAAIAREKEAGNAVEIRGVLLPHFRRTNPVDRQSDIPLGPRRQVVRLVLGKAVRVRPHFSGSEIREVVGRFWQQRSLIDADPFQREDNRAGSDIRVAIQTGAVQAETCAPRASVTHRNG